MKLMFDTNTFDKMLLSSIDKMLSCEEHDYYITSIQIEELGNIPDTKKEQRIQNLISLCMLRAHLLYTPAVIGATRIGLSVLADENDAYESLLNENKSNINDAIIGSTAKRENCTVVTNDGRFARKLKANDIPAITFEEFVDLLE